MLTAGTATGQNTRLFRVKSASLYYNIPMITILGISGSMRWPSHTHSLLEIALGAARESGARVELLDLHVQDLPLYEPRAHDIPPAVTEFRERCADAQAFILGTPEYHGSMSGALKNALDYLYAEASGKLFGALVATGSGQAATVHAHLRDIVSAYHAWSLPYGVTAELADFDDAGHVATTRLRETLLRFGRDMAVYGAMLYEQFSHDRVLGGGVQHGFAPWHAE